MVAGKSSAVDVVVTIAATAVVAAAVAWIVRPDLLRGEDTATYVFAVIGGGLGTAGLLGGAAATRSSPTRGAVAVLLGTVAIALAVGAVVSLHLLPSGH